MSEETSIKALVIMVLLSIAMISGAGLFISDISKNYDLDANTTYINNSREYLSELNESTSNLKDAVTDFEYWNPLGYFEGIKAVMSLLWNSGQVSGDFIIGLPVIFEIAGLMPLVWFLGILSIIIAIYIVFRLAGIYFKTGGAT